MMCLDRLRKSDDKWPKYQREDGDIIGYKAFSKPNQYLMPLIKGEKKALPLNKWLNEKDYRYFRLSMDDLVTSDGTRYPMGFHVYLNLEDVKYWSGVYYIVKVRKIVARGFQADRPVIVAKEMMILREAE